jgi:hypothetical protein
MSTLQHFALLCRYLATRLLLAFAGIGLTPGIALGQAEPDSLSPISQLFGQFQARTPTEKLFMHLDRPGYVSGETMWFKLYLVEGTTQRPLAASTVAYVEVLSPDNVPVLQAKIALRNAIGHGSLELPVGLAPGCYLVRAYTSWMQNFGPEFYFQTPVTIIDTHQPLGVPLASPVITYDPQFFPEGGYLVQGLLSKVGFKLTDSRGRSVAAEGTILDEAGRSVAHFSTLWAGLGSFAFTPAKAGVAYKAVIKLPNHQIITRVLPPVRKQGYVLHLEDADSQRLRLVVQAQGPAATSETVFLLGHAGQRVVLAAKTQMHGGQVEFSVLKQQLAAGISHFTLFNSQRQPLCERLYFRPPAATLALAATVDKAQYAPREKVTLQVAAPGPQPANLSVAVYQLDSLSAAGGADITSYLWLAADLKGQVEAPSRYFTPGPEVAAAADNLMLTQGWSRFQWAKVLAPKSDSLPHLPELNGPVLRGQVLARATGAPAPHVPVYLASPSRRIQLYTASSQADGHVQFELPDLYGPRQLVIQTDPRRDSVYRVEIQNPFSTHYAASAAPLLPSSLLATSLLRRHVQRAVQERYFGAPQVRYAAPLLDSAAFYGLPTEHYLLNKYTRFKVMEEVLREYVPGVLVRIHKDGFHFIVPDYQRRESMENPLVLLDGVPVFNVNRMMAFDPLKVRRLDVLTTRYFLGPLVLPGVISFSTYKGDLAGFPLDPHALLQEYEGLQGTREFYAPRYETAATAQSRLPDFRNLLYWNPTVSTTPGASATNTFYTSDQVGKYCIVVQGITSDGLTGSTSLLVEVKAPL